MGGELDRAEGDLFGTAQREELCPEPARAVIGIGIDALVDNRGIVASSHQGREEAGIVTSAKAKQLFGGDHGETDRLDAHQNEETENYFDEGIAVLRRERDGEGEAELRVAWIEVARDGIHENSSSFTPHFSSARYKPQRRVERAQSVRRTEQPARYASPASTTDG